MAETDGSAVEPWRLVGCWPRAQAQARPQLRGQARPALRANCNRSAKGCQPSVVSPRFFSAFGSEKKEARGAIKAPRAGYPRPDEATSDTSCRCYLRGPDGVRRLPPSGTWDTRNLVDSQSADNAAPTRFTHRAPRQRWRHALRRPRAPWRSRPRRDARHHAHAWDSTR